MLNFASIDPITLCTRLIILFIALPLHELAHAWVADRLGDSTPRLAGRLNPNPLAHLDIIGSILILTKGFGWAKPVPIDPNALRRRSPAGVMLVSLAGPLMNLLLAVIAIIPFRFKWVNLLYSVNADVADTIWQILAIFISINIFLMLFNLLPLAPLDGEKIAEFLWPPSWVRVLDIIRPYSSFVLLGVIFLLPYVGIDIIDWFLDPVGSTLVRFFMGM